jgi:hypothetical protein
MGGNRSTRAVGALALLAAGLISCGSGAADSVAADARTAAVYNSVLTWVLDAEPGVGAAEKPEWTLFVAPRSEIRIDLDVQVAVIEALDPSIFVRFVDERAEAVHDDVADNAVRDDGILVGLGAVEQEGDSVEVYVDRYRNANEVEAWWMFLRRSGNDWQLVGTPESTDVRPLPTDP